MRSVPKLNALLRPSLLGFSDRGTVQKVIVLPRDDLQTEELVLEEVEVFRVSFVILVQEQLLFLS